MFHLYSADWTPTHINFYIDTQLIRAVHQSPNYPMLFMLGIYERPKETAPQAAGEPSSYPKNFVVDYVRAYQPLNGYLYQRPGAINNIGSQAGRVAPCDESVFIE